MDFLTQEDRNEIIEVNSLCWDWLEEHFGGVFQVEELTPNQQTYVIFVTFTELLFVDFMHFVHWILHVYVYLLFLR